MKNRVILAVIFMIFYSCAGSGQTKKVKVGEPFDIPIRAEITDLVGIKFHVNLDSSFMRINSITDLGQFDLKIINDKKNKVTAALVMSGDRKITLKETILRINVTAKKKGMTAINFSDVEAAFSATAPADSIYVDTPKSLEFFDYLGMLRLLFEIE